MCGTFYAREDCPPRRGFCVTRSSQRLQNHRVEFRVEFRVTWLSTRWNDSGLGYRDRLRVSVRVDIPANSTANQPVNFVTKISSSRHSSNSKLDLKHRLRIMLFQRISDRRNLKTKCSVTFEKSFSFWFHTRCEICGQFLDAKRMGSTHTNFWWL